MYRGPWGCPWGELLPQISPNECREARLKLVTAHVFSITVCIVAKTSSQTLDVYWKILKKKSAY